MLILKTHVTLDALRIAEVLSFGLSPTSGVVGAVAELSRQIASAGHDAVLLIPGAWPGTGPSVLDDLRAAGVVVEVVDGDSRRSIARSIAERIGATGCDVVNIHNGFSPMNNLVARLTDVPYVVTTHGVYATESLTHHRGRKRLAIAMTDRSLLQKAAAVTALTSVEAQEVATVAPGVVADVLPLGFKPAVVTVDRAALRTEIGLPEATPLVLFGGRLDVYMKRLDSLVHGVADAPNWHLVLMGADFKDGRTDLAKIVAERGIGSRVHFLEPRSGQALSDAFAGATITALVSRWEGLPRGLIEPMLLGMPALVSDEVERRVPVVSDGGGWLTAPSEVGAALREIEQLDATKLQEAGLQASSIAERYLWPSVLPHWIEMFERVTNG